MSIEIKTTLRDIGLRASGDFREYDIVAINLKDNEVLLEGTYSPEEYLNSIKNLWYNYLYKNEKPKLLGYGIPNGEFLSETIHIICVYHKTGISLTYWLMGELNKISEVMGKENADILKRNLEAVIRDNLKEQY